MVETKSGRARRARPRLHRLLGRRRSRRLGRRAVRARRRRRQHALSDHDVPAERRRLRRAAGEAWTTIPALMDAAEERGVKFPRKGAIVRPQKHCDRVARQRHADEEPRTAARVDGTDARRTDRRRDRRPPPGDAVLRLPEARGAGLRQLLRRRHPAAARHPRDAAHHRPLPAQRRRRAHLRELSPTPSASTAGRSRPTSPATSNGAGRRSPQSRGFNQLPYRMLLPHRLDNLLVAGRCASMTHEGQSAARVSGACFVMGQAAATRGASGACRQCRQLADIPVEALQGLLENATAPISGATSTSQ